MHLHAALCLTLPKIASHIQYAWPCATVLIHIFIVHRNLPPALRQNYKLYVHTAHVKRHARLCLTLMDQQLVDWAIQCMKLAGAVCNSTVRSKFDIPCAPVYSQLNTMRAFKDYYIKCAVTGPIISWCSTSTQSAAGIKISVLGTSNSQEADRTQGL